MDVQIFNHNNINVVSSRIIADQLEKEHKNVVRDIEKIQKEIGSDLSVLNNNAALRSEAYFIESYYQDTRKRNQREYLLTQNGFTLLVMNYQGYNKFKIAYINEFNRLKEQEHNKLPTSYKDALIELVSQVEANEQLQLENNQMKPKVDYTDTILLSKALVSTTSIAKDYGMSAQELNDILHEQGVQYKQGGQWFLYSKYQDKGYAQSKTFNVGTAYDPNIKTNTQWTQKGRLFIHEMLKNLGKKPNVEKLKES